ncbi:hypothetical protein SAMN05216359_101124 [Roseateles sp. YR242]|uniref:hypothetical protein n=1 Tax=Roseateles sp. YR242 TaxID=1855305 RepID=UPI0008C0153D|nr:hypothetical protein [Roseateles sp. YR242]SEK23666.1 hypothetical protein SAMN05216359_101124 [Roseateles sp. YR242]
MNTTTIASISNSTSFKAFAFGFIATVALAAGVVHAEVKRERAASVITLDTVYITGKRAPQEVDQQVAQQATQQEVQTLPTVVITGHRTTTIAENIQVAAL